jgi:hypothetical protein
MNRLGLGGGVGLRRCPKYILIPSVIDFRRHIYTCFGYLSFEKELITEIYLAGIVPILKKW